MEQRDDMENGDEVLMPGFRFHPTDEELVGFYLKRKIQQKPLCIELIRQLDIYKYDPWDLPKLATTGEKEWYFYCPRDRKYRNSARPNRVTGAGFWKATGTDKPIYSSEGTKCVGLKKSLVFYKGRAAKCTKTDWMMHEFRLPSLSDASIPKKPLDKNIPLNESWAICRILKKNNSTAHRAISNSWVSPVPDTTTESDFFLVGQTINANQFVAEAPSSTIQFQQQQSSAINYPALDSDTSFESTCFIFSQEEVPVESLLDLSADTVSFSQHPQQNVELFTRDLPLDSSTHNIANDINDNQWGNMKTASFPFCTSPNISQEWNLNSPWGSSLYPSELSASFSTNICYS